MSFIAAAIGVVGAVAGGAIAAGGAESAAQTQADAARNAQALQQQNFNTIQGNEAPFLGAGQGAASQLNYLLGTGTPGASGTASSSTAGGYGSLTQPFNAQAFHDQSPQYQFNLQQGAQGVLNQDASSQGADSGAALKDLMSFNQGYANNAYNSAFSNYQTQQNNIFNRLNTIATLGSNAGSNNATGASQFSNGIANSAQNVGTALAGGTVGAANAASGAINNASAWLQAGNYGGGGGGVNQATINAENNSSNNAITNYNNSMPTDPSTISGLPSTN